MFVNSDDFGGTPILFYSEQDRLVRIYPHTEGTMTSEALELFTLTAGNAGILRHVAAARRQ